MMVTHKTIAMSVTDVPPCGYRLAVMVFGRESPTWMQTTLGRQRLLHADSSITLRVEGQGRQPNS
jgi:hypothetical protein